MPPLRNMSTVKPIKTERTHEENQERAYIAASRRSDRSLEARVESARRASEIHKRRTGRALKVTEQDVINEEMYEEEDDDLPLQYRRLTANLQTGSLDFNRKLAAYLTHNVAVRSALGQAINDSFAQQYPGAQQFPHNQNPMFPSPLNTANMGQAAMGSMSQSPQQATPTSPHPYRQTPYPMPGTTGFRGPPQHKRANSSTVSQAGDSQAYPNTAAEAAPSNFRRMSMPVDTKPEVKAETSNTGLTSATSSPGVASKHASVQKNSTGQMGPPQQPEQPFFDFQQSSIHPLTMTLPQDTQQLLAASMAPNDPLTSMLIDGNNLNNFYNFNDYSSNIYGQNGINATLAPNAYNMHEQLQVQSNNTMADQTNNAFADYKGVHYVGNPSSGLNTPGEQNFDSWINDDWSGDTT